MHTEQRLSHLCLGSNDLDRTVAFYGDLIGTEVVHEFFNEAGERYGVFLKIGEGTFLEFFNQQNPVPQGGLFRHFCLQVADIEAMAEKARAKGFECDVRRGRSDRVLQFFIHDPDGTMIEFQQHDEQSVLLSFL